MLVQRPAKRAGLFSPNAVRPSWRSALATRPTPDSEALGGLQARVTEASPTRFKARLCPASESRRQGRQLGGEDTRRPERIIGSTLHQTDLLSLVHVEDPGVRRRSRCHRLANECRQPGDIDRAQRTPRRAAGTPNVAAGVAIRRSHTTASCKPAPRAAPLDGRYNRGWVGDESRRATCRTLGRKVSPPPCSKPPTSAARRPRSAPAQNALSPEPAMTIERRPAFDSNRPRSSSHSSALSAFRRSGRSMVANPTAPSNSHRIGTSTTRPISAMRSPSCPASFGCTCKLAHDAGHLGHDRDLIFIDSRSRVRHLGDELSLIDDHLPNVGRDLRANLVHDRRLAPVTTNKGGTGPESCGWGGSSGDIGTTARRNEP